ncbi:uncharacterized protein LOC6558938 [Drosophila grimshawi]|uniref:GH17159 n=1 Tax=Drosophila grimshawi TaxID=7222 RepID=B4J172_DROGR|nr:uncharacterized protein LOC6558938 [Drosophila grimshawi]EDV97941.1 GH17159 [Drosophila grimshawi]
MSRQNLSIKAERKQQKQLKKQFKAKKQQQDKIKKHPKKRIKKSTGNISIHYQLFLYRQEMRRANTDFSYLRLSRAKIMLTAELIDKNMGRWSDLCTVDDLKMLSREVQFKKRLCTQVERLEQFQELGLTDVVLNGKKMTL